MKYTNIELSSRTSKKTDSEIILCNVYGHNIDNISAQVGRIDFEKLYKEAGHSKIVELVIDNKKLPCLIHEIQFDKVTSSPIHVDFYVVKMDEKITTEVPLEFIGESKGVYVEGGQLLTNLTLLEVECLPKDLPASIEVDVSNLDNIGDSIHVKDVAVDKLVTVLNDPETIVVQVDEITESEPEAEETESTEEESETQAEETTEE